MKRVTRNVEPGAVGDLLERPPRAYVAFAEAGTLAAEPVAFRVSAKRYFIGMPQARSAAVSPGTPVTVLIDDGWYWVELRAVKIRGRAAPAEPPPAGAPSDLAWLEVSAGKVVAWDYGSLREEESHAP